MFTIRANYSDAVEVAADIESVRAFFANIRNFIELMPGIESIHTDANGIRHWKIRAEVPLAGVLLQKFAVRQTADDADLIEWSPLEGETKNFLRYAAELHEIGATRTRVRFTQAVEMRRQSARELHILAAFVNENLISREMSKRIAEMIGAFVTKAKRKMESG